MGTNTANWKRKANSLLHNRGRGSERIVVQMTPTEAAEEFLRPYNVPKGIACVCDLDQQIHTKCLQTLIKDARARSWEE